MKYFSYTNVFIYPNKRTNEQTNKMPQFSAMVEGIVTQFDNSKEMDEFFAEKKRNGYVYEYRNDCVVYLFKTEAEIAPCIARLERRKPQIERIRKSAERKKQMMENVKEFNYIK